MRRPSPLSCPRSVHCRHTPLSITFESSSRRPSPSPLRLRRPSSSITVKELSCRLLLLSRHHAVHCRRTMLSIATVLIAVTVAPSIAKAPSIAVAPSITVAAVDIASRSRLLSPSCCRCTVQCVALPSHHPLLSPLRHRRAPFPLLLLVDCCLFTHPLLPARLPLLLLSSTLRHRCVVVGDAIVVAVVVIIVLPSTHTHPCLPSLPPAFVDCHTVRLTSTGNPVPGKQEF